MRMLPAALIVVGLIGACLGNPPPTPLEENSWALLVAGSYNYDNYRHQADVCHAYHVMIAEGIPPERIVVMMYDDIAYHEENPTKGVIINRPNGTNVYAGVKIDYKSENVSPQNFLNVLQGNKKAMAGKGTGRVIESTKGDSIFVYFADHGSRGLLSFPHDALTALDLEKTLVNMHNNKQYNKLIMYVEACEAGSMFDNILPENINVFVATASARDERSFGLYCTDTCLGDEFSVAWMEHMDQQKKGSVETFFSQYQKVRSTVKKSHVNIYGDLSLGVNALTPNRVSHQQSQPEWVQYGTAVNSRDVPLHYLRQKLARSTDVESQAKAQTELSNLIEVRKQADELFEKIVSAATNDAPQHRDTIEKENLLLNKSMFPCYKKLLNTFATQCFGYEHKYFLQHFYKLANICLLELDTDKFVQNMPSLCQPYKAFVMTSVV